MDTQTDPRDVCAQRNWGHVERDSEKKHTYQHLDLRLPEWWENSFLLFQPPGLRYFAMACPSRLANTLYSPFFTQQPEWSFESIPTLCSTLPYTAHFTPGKNQSLYVAWKMPFSRWPHLFPGAARLHNSQGHRIPPTTAPFAPHCSWSLLMSWKFLKHTNCPPALWSAHAALCAPNTLPHIHAGGSYYSLEDIPHCLVWNGWTLPWLCTSLHSFTFLLAFIIAWHTVTFQCLLAFVYFPQVELKFLEDRDWILFIRLYTRGLGQCLAHRSSLKGRLFFFFLIKQKVGWRLFELCLGLITSLLAKNLRTKSVCSL